MREELCQHDLIDPFVSSNAWDYRGAKADVLVQPHKSAHGALGVTTDYEVERLDEIPERIGL